MLANKLITERFVSTLLLKRDRKRALNDRDVIGNAVERFLVVRRNCLELVLNQYMEVFDRLEARHRNCEYHSHYIMFFDGMVFALHPDKADQCNGDVLMRVQSASGLHLSKSQRATIRNRLESILKGKS